jgi:hypothetical protein
MENVKLSVAGNVLTITIDLSAQGAPSATGKTIVIASTRGNASVPGTPFKLGLNLYRARS